MQQANKEIEKKRREKEDSPPNNVKLPLYDIKRKGKISLYDRLYMPHFVNFNKSDEHCRVCPACRQIRAEIEPYKHLFQFKGKVKRKSNTKRGSKSKSKSKSRSKSKAKKL